MLIEVVLALVVIALALAVVVVAWRGLHARPPVVTAPAPSAPIPSEPSGRAPLPVILVHGLFGFDRIGVPGVRFDYFRGVAKHLGKLGCHAHAVRLPSAKSVPERARELVDAIEAMGHERIDLIAHSLGGLDARYALAHLGLARHVRSLVTVGTPHRGSPIADLVLRGSASWVHRGLTKLGLTLDAIEWLSTDALARFNDDVRDVPGVRYACVVGGIHRKDTSVPIALVPFHRYLRKVAGVNDGLVPVSSQYWGETLADVEADHFAQIGWNIGPGKTFDALGLYAYVVSRLGGSASGMARGTHVAQRVTR